MFAWLTQIELSVVKDNLVPSLPLHPHEWSYQPHDQPYSCDLLLSILYIFFSAASNFRYYCLWLKDLIAYG